MNVALTNSSIQEKNWNILGGSVLSNYISFCGTFNMVGGYNIFGKGLIFEKSYNSLSTHYKVRLIFNFLKIDEWNGASFQILSDSTLVYSVLFANSEDSNITKYCGLNFPEAHRMIDVLFNHSSSSLFLQMKTTITSSLGFWGLYNISLFILQCDAVCASCIGPLENDCMSCYPGKFLKNVPGPSTCINPCPDGYFSNFITGLCEICHSSCLTCFGATSKDCTSCYKGYFLMTVAPDFSCVQACPASFWVDISSYTCKPCDSSCFSCDGSSSSDCLSCMNGRYILSGVCYETCPYATFGDSSSMSCQAICPEFTYSDWSSRVCLSCHKKCLNCFSLEENQCSQCFDGYFLQDSSCVQTCSEEYFLDNDEKACISKFIFLLFFYNHYRMC